MCSTTLSTSGLGPVIKPILSLQQQHAHMSKQAKRDVLGFRVVADVQPGVFLLENLQTSVTHTQFTHT